ncbi:phage major capsid protein [Dyella ginsengisoli]|uniref:Phage major capsid protein n=1 Tax=Dyella ginsengisoli TaxID=363848 RepID=A0ABW8JWD0_9GAMM
MSLPEALNPGSTGERILRIGTERAVVDEAARTVTLAFASETPVQRFWGNEILDVQSRSIRLDRLNAGGPLLMDHDMCDQVGVIESVQIGTDRVARAVVRFGKSARANEVFQDVVDGIRQNVSVGYLIHNAMLESENEGVGTYRVDDWEPYEISMVSVPADIKAGIGRQAEPPKPRIPEITMSETTTAPDNTAAIEAARAAGTEGERKRVAEITAAADALKNYKGVRDLATAAVTGGWPLEQFRAKVMDAIATQPLPTANIGMTEGEAKRFSFVRALNALANPGDARAREEAAFEFEASRAAADKQGRSVKGLLVPFDVLNAKRELTVGTPANGGDLVATDLLSGNFIDLLRNRMVLNKMGTQFLSGLVGNVAIPRQTGGATFYIVTEGNAPTASLQSFDQVPMSPKTGAGRTQISRKLLLQSSISIESFVQRDLATVMALGMQAIGIKGGGSNEPVGILATSGIGSVVGGTNGAAPTWGNIIDLETAIAQANADVGAMGYLTNAKVRGKLKQTQKFSGANADPIWGDGNTPLNGYMAGVTNAVPSNLTKGTSAGDCSAIIFGNFADLIYGMWGGLELQVDPYSSGDTGSVIVRAFQDFDVAVRHAESFAAMQDALTA